MTEFRRKLQSDILCKQEKEEDRLKQLVETNQMNRLSRDRRMRQMKNSILTYKKGEAKSIK
jgi:hypothetical protein